MIKSAEFVKGVVGTNPILTDGLLQVAFVGRSNVGKSSVINSLTNKKDLVKVSQRPGKTLELNFFLINKKYYFVDLPGYGFAQADAEKQEKIRKLILWYVLYSEVRPALFVLILDVKAGCTEFDREMLKVLREQNHPYIIVANKIDKLNQKELAAQIKSIQQEAVEAEIILYSTIKGVRTDNLLGRIESYLK